MTKLRQTTMRPLWLFLATAILLLGGGVRLLNLGGDSLWLDETATLNVVHNGNDLLSYGERDHPPMLYWMTALSVNVWGESEFVLRLPSFFGGMAAIALLFLFGRIIGRINVALWAALFLALSPFHLKYSQEARHYSLLMVFSLLSCLLLYRALKKPTWRTWLAFSLATALNLYTHYGAFVLLAAQGLLIGGELLLYLRSRRYRPLRYLIGAAILTLLLYSPWLSHAWEALQSNTGEAAAVGTTGITSIATWLRSAFYAFGFGNGWLPYLLAGLSLIGIFIWLRRRDWHTLMLVAAVLIAPLLIISLLQVSRWAFPKYIIYMLPLYLLSAAAGLDALLSKSKKRVLPFVIAVLLLVACWPLLRQEHALMERDWRGAVGELGQMAQDGDLFISMAMDLEDGFNQGGLSAPYYLDREFQNYTLLSGNSLRPDTLPVLATQTGDVWALILNRVVALDSAETELLLSSFQGGLYIAHLPQQSSSTLGKAITLYQHAIPFALAPSPRCLMYQDLTVLHLAQPDFEAANRSLAQARTLCPASTPLRQSLEGEIYRGLLAQALEVGDDASARQWAAQLLRLDAKDEAALELLTVDNLLQRFQAGEVVIVSDSAEPVELRRFTMPHNGDWGDVIFAHPPTALEFQITLPPQPTALVFRVANDPASWEWGGDGTTFIVQVGSEGDQELFRLHLGNDSAERAWHDVFIPLDDFAGQLVTLRFLTEGGAANDFSADWAGWETPRIVWPQYRHTPNP